MPHRHDKKMAPSSKQLVRLDVSDSVSDMKKAPVIINTQSYKVIVSISYYSQLIRPVSAGTVVMQPAEC